MLSNWLTGSNWSAGSKRITRLILILTLATFSACVGNQATVVSDFCALNDRLHGGEIKLSEVTKEILAFSRDDPGVARDVNALANQNRTYRCLCEKRDCP